jgi:ubiquitin-activating enzyme E1
LTNSIEFEKDNEQNNHINSILSFSNLRANNYNIENTDFLKVKEIAGNIIPEIA